MDEQTDPMRVRTLSRALALLVAMPAGHADDRRPHILEFDREKEVRETLQRAVERRVIPGAVFWIEREGQTIRGAIGRRAVIPRREAMSEDTIFDLASLTKVVATAPSVMLLLEQGRIRLDDGVAEHLPEFAGEQRERITLRHLLTHVSGLKPSLPKEPAWTGYETGVRLACVSVPEHGPGEVFRYSDINFILLGEVVRRVSGLPLPEFARRHLFEPLAMKDTGFNPAPALRGRIAPTERDERKVMLRGMVHDPSARRMGGVAGHAGLFGTAADLARFGRMILNGGELDGARVLRAETVRRMTAVQTPVAMLEKRGLGWDIDSRYSRPRGALFPIGSFGHTGFTGTCMWMDPFSRTFFVFLSSRLHATDSRTDARLLYDEMGTEAALCVLNFDFFDVPGALQPTERTLR